MYVEEKQGKSAETHTLTPKTMQAGTQSHLVTPITVSDLSHSTEIALFYKALK